MADLREAAEQLYKEDDTELSHEWIVNAWQDEWRKTPWQHAPEGIRHHFMVMAMAESATAKVVASVGRRAAE